MRDEFLALLVKIWVLRNVQRRSTKNPSQRTTALRSHLEKELDQFIDRETSAHCLLLPAEPLDFEELPF